MREKSFKKIMVFFLALMLTLSFSITGNVQGVQAASVKTPSMKKAAIVKDGVKVTWKKVSGASGYNIYRKDGKGKWKKIDTVKKGTTLSYTDKKVISGTTYSYSVSANKGKKSSSYNKNGVSLVYLATPKSVSFTPKTGTATVKWSKVKGSKGYYIYRKGTSGSYKKIATVKKNSYTDKSVSAGGKFTYGVKAYNGKNVSLMKTVSGTVPAKTTQPAADQTIENTASEYSIEADVSLTGTGTGYHAKLVACTATSAFSFGIQHDEHAAAPYTGKTAFMTENVYSNAAGGQQYQWIRLGEKNKTYHLMLTVKKDGTCNCYIDGKLVKTAKNPNLARTTVYLRVEGSARKNRDSVKAVFSNIRLKANGKYDAAKSWGTHDFTTNKGVRSNASAFAGTGTVTISGKIKGIGSSEDWDSAYEKVSGIIQFVG